MPPGFAQEIVELFRLARFRRLIRKLARFGQILLDSPQITVCCATEFGRDNLHAVGCVRLRQIVRDCRSAKEIGFRTQPVAGIADLPANLPLHLLGRDEPVAILWTDGTVGLRRHIAYFRPRVALLIADTDKFRANRRQFLLQPASIASGEAMRISTSAVLRPGPFSDATSSHRRLRLE